MGRTAGKRERLYGGDSGYPLMLLYRGKLYGVNSEELLQTILESGSYTHLDVYKRQDRVSTMDTTHTVRNAAAFCQIRST